MDLLLEIADTLVFDRVYATVFPNQLGDDYHPLFWANPNSNQTALYSYKSLIPSDVYGQPYLLDPTDYANLSRFGRDNLFRQSLSIFIFTWVFGYLVYIIPAGLSYLFAYDKRNFKHPRYLKNQVRLELRQSLTSIPVMTMLTVPWFVGEITGYSKLYWKVEDYGMWYMILQFPFFIMFTDFGIYCIHRWLHWPSVYKHLHKPHHKWIVPTPFASHAFHPVDGYAQSLPYHIFPFLFPLHKLSYLFLFVFINIWTVMIHDGEYISNNPVVNGSAHHTVHHLYFNYNYGQYTTLWDRLGRSHRTPDQELFDKNLKLSDSTWKKQVHQFEEIAKQVEGKDDRVYINDDKKSQ